MIICYTVPEIWRVTHEIIIFSFWAIFCPLTPPLPNSPKNENFKKMKTKPGDIIILHVYQKLWLDHDWFLRYGA